MHHQHHLVKIGSIDFELTRYFLDLNNYNRVIFGALGLVCLIAPEVRLIDNQNLVLDFSFVPFHRLLMPILIELSFQKN